MQKKKTTKEFNNSYFTILFDRKDNKITESRAKIFCKCGGTFEFIPEFSLIKEKQEKEDDLFEFKLKPDEFNFNIEPKSFPVRFGTKNAEEVNVFPNHFIPKFRWVYISSKLTKKQNGGYYITSSITGDYRKFRGKYSQSRAIKNIFGHGKTLEIATNDFVNNFYIH